MKFQKKYIIIVITILLLGAVLLFILPLNNSNEKESSGSTVTGFEDSSGWFYKCSKPIPAKLAMVAHAGGQPTKEAVAANPQDVTQYCHKVGIE